MSIAMVYCRLLTWLWPVLLFSTVTSVSAQSITSLANHQAPLDSTPDPEAAAPDSKAMESKALEPLIVVVSKTPRPLSDVIGSVRVLRSGQLEASLVQDIDQLFRYEPGVQAERSGTRFGATGVNIRGIGGNRISMEIDGVPVRDQFAVGSFSNAGRDALETDWIERVEILNGPASTLYGSDAIGGVIAVTTWDPDRWLQGNDQSWGARLRAGYHGEDDSHYQSGMVAWADDTTGLLAAITRRNGHELDNRAPANTPSDRQDWDTLSGFFKATVDLGPSQRLRLTVNDFERDRHTDVRAVLGSGRFRNTNQLLGDDHESNRSIVLDYQFQDLWTFDDGVLRVYHQASDVTQLTREARALATMPVRLQRDFFYDQDNYGVELNVFRNFFIGGSTHRIGAGLEFITMRTEELRDGRQISLNDGSVSNTILGEVFPLRDFPISDTDEWGLFLHDEIEFENSPWSLVAGLRYDSYRLTPRLDSIYREDNPGTDVVGLSDDAVTPKLGLLYRFSQQWSAFSQYVRGFRAPPFEDANIGLDIPLFRIRALPNPDLKSETSNAVEAGVRRIHRHGQFSFSAFWTDYSDFIETRARIGVDPADGTLLFQSRNIDQARIYGFEFSWQQALVAWSPGLAQFHLHAAGYWARGDNQQNDQPLNTISPAQAVLGLRWLSMSERFNLNAVATVTRAQRRVDQTDGERFLPPGYVTLDMFTSWRFARNWMMRGGVFNVTNKKYWRWLDISALTPDDPLIESLSRPGRNFSVNLEATF